MHLEQPSVDYIESFFEAIAESARERMPQFPAQLTRESFPAYVQRLNDQATGRNLPQGHVPFLELWMIDEEGYAGRIILGLAFYPGPTRVGHHVGYAVRPSKRRLGYATQALRDLIVEAKRREIEKLNPTCASDNQASRRVIERNGGILLNPEPGETELRFLIDLVG